MKFGSCDSFKTVTLICSGLSLLKISVTYSEFPVDYESV